MKQFADAQVLRKAVLSMEWMFRPRELWSALFVAVFCLLLTASGFSQGIATGSISGTVTDPTGSVVPGAKVTVLSKATNQASTAVTSDVGFFAVRSLPPG